MRWKSVPETEPITLMMDDGFSYNVIRRPKRKTLSIVIRATNDVDVLAPSRMPLAVIDQFVSSKSIWIQRKLLFNREIRSQYRPKLFLAGETFKLLDTPLRLATRAGKRGVELIDDKLVVTLPASLKAESREETIKRLLVTWFRDQAENHFKQRSKVLSQLIGRTPASVATKHYKSRWGSCHHDGRIYFNWRLIMAPARIIDYVIVHELCHLIHHNHSTAYWSLVESIMPDFRSAKQWLKINGATLEI
ncbi:hypothetical protein Ga0123462_0920 [Mariprofundus ferrinatatus]|uniref:YgjP-like metallopeptidase domain-containing protein n=1 Tax=Mariprofundus ferrinatatus TaxID=1921087 RepID=A0A2K8L6A9_9PROT|nr:SprT family zinc-dependent metalloprotease [Mariprofundus ferrinatatus]ATX81789.1 hypothetical protein Ga0123462_0920 [Mariprofundus ferrinatatus]